MRKDERSRGGIDGTRVLEGYDRVTGIFNEIFDSRLLTAALFALLGYCTLFTQRKFPMRWMVFVLFGMILLAFVTLTARSDQRARALSSRDGRAVGCAAWDDGRLRPVLSGLAA